MLPSLYHLLPATTSNYQQLPATTSNYQQLPATTSNYQQLPATTSNYQQLWCLQTSTVSTGLLPSLYQPTTKVYNHLQLLQCLQCLPSLYKDFLRNPGIADDPKADQEDIHQRGDTQDVIWSRHMVSPTHRRRQRQAKQQRETHNKPALCHAKGRSAGDSRRTKNITIRLSIRTC
ncbi:hypothetical protein EDB84DRAFT_1563216 [Lactarius hengduanensis]|nr:hypothetical protein EDB84DRAFT_1563216 [Lactarius hengduanensis]